LNEDKSNKDKYCVNVEGKLGGGASPIADTEIKCSAPRWRRESDRRHRNKMRRSSVAALLGGGAIPIAATEIKKGPTLADRPLVSL